MTGIILSPEIRALLLEQHKENRDGRVKDRIKAVILRDDGWSLEAIAEALLISHEGVRQHLLDYTHRNSRVAMGISNSAPKAWGLRCVASVSTSRISILDVQRV